MMLETKTYCGRCHKPTIERGVYAHKESPGRIDVVYVCSNPQCDRAEAICIQDQYNLLQKQKYSILGAIFKVQKSLINKFYTKL